MEVPRRHRLFRQLAHAVFRKTRIPAIVTLIVIVAAGVYAHRQNAAVFDRDLRSAVLSKVSVVRAKLEGNVNGNIQLVRGLVATLATEPNMSQARFSELVSNLLADRSQLRHIVAAPDLVVRLFYPVEGNERVYGLDYNRIEEQREAAYRARDTGTLVFAGPVDLVQGGQGFIGRFPVFLTRKDGGRDFWGILSAVIDTQALFRDSGLLDPDLPIDIAIVGRDALGTRGELFFGKSSVLQGNPVTADVVVPSGTWRIAAVPKGGWPAVPPRTWQLWLLIALAGALIMAPIVLSARLIEERTKNIGELRRRERQMRRMSRRLELAVDSSRIGVWELNADDDSLLWDARMNELYGYPTDGGARTYADWQRRIHPEDLARVLEAFPHPPLPDTNLQIEYRLTLPNGEVRHVRECAKSYQDPGEPLKLVGVNWDVTADVTLREHLKRANMLSEARNADLEAAKARIEFNALHDSLTGLPNRRFLDEVLARHVESKDGERAGLLHIDLDRFKQINDTLGHAAGDAMLVHAAAVLKGSLQPEDFVARVGGDEFVVICMTPAGTDLAAWTQKLADLADEIIAKMHQPVTFKGHECRFGVSIGIATDTGEDANPGDLLVHADIALYRAKSRGRNRHQFFNDALQEEIITTKRIADEILSGLERNEFVAYYQPQFDATTHDVIGVEALVRWRHPSKGLLAPRAFLKTAEELNVVATLDRMILEQTLAQLAQWDEMGLSVPKASVNVSARRLHDEELISSLRELELEPGRISFELVESIFLDENDELITWNVEQIKGLGIDVEIDDFGTGHASIVSLLKLLPSRLKIDRQLIMPVLRSPAQRKLVRSIVEIGKSLGIEVLAEGVETLHHARVLKDLGCTGLQGYVFARPMSSDELTDFLKSRVLARAS
ncbi:EAL domain-containing protein [Arvimicrobium flavum]|uniref:bifunctional diguanylate cyclase/phosphodiesterase n=1 Tax=Arvimicrobium flavum TaxID=3393320 RepID=UPI00237B8152|nr:EAL domain-containing protein [Mesorhizobium shangrilense]